MKRITILLLAVLLIFISGCSKPEKADTQMKYSFETDREKESYAVGFRAGIQLYGMVRTIHKYYSMYHVILCSLYLLDNVIYGITLFAGLPNGVNI